jgi:hypothetical protein
VEERRAEVRALLDRALPDGVRVDRRDRKAVHLARVRRVRETPPQDRVPGDHLAPGRRRMTRTVVIPGMRTEILLAGRGAVKGMGMGTGGRLPGRRVAIPVPRVAIPVRKTALLLKPEPQIHQGEG